MSMRLKPPRRRLEAVISIWPVPYQRGGTGRLESKVRT